MFGRKPLTDSEGWPVLVDDDVREPSGWDSETLAQLVETDAPAGPKNDLDPLDGFVFPSMRRRNPIPALAIVGLVLGLGSAGWWFTHRPGVTLADIHPTDCLALPSEASLAGKELTRFTRVPCSGPHNALVFANKNFNTDAAFPGGDLLATAARNTCADAVPADIKANPRAESWRILYFAPLTSQTYHRGEKATLLCVVSYPDNITG